ncbi:hypothetical protein SDC9_84206 [bioreactor metagenome]|uniref:Uncharacterized protein n=1 Tax=bioreactor metagenome TaxID=1076179 RepID=A0A644ZBC7_9ZZZZ
MESGFCAEGVHHGIAVFAAVGVLWRHDDFVQKKTAGGGVHHPDRQMQFGLQALCRQQHHLDHLSLSANQG